MISPDRWIGKLTHPALVIGAISLRPVDEFKTVSTLALLAVT